jgi:hypothetical protein
VFTVLEDFSYKPSFIFSTGEHRFPRSDFGSPEQLTKYMMLDQIFETHQFLVIKYRYKKKLNLIFIDKNNRESFLTYLESNNNGGIFNDLDGGTMFQLGGASFRSESYFVENSREYITGLINPYQLKAHVASSEFKNSVPKYSEKKKELEKLVNSLKETDNPVLMLVRLKK